MKYQLPDSAKDYLTNCYLRDTLEPFLANLGSHNVKHDIPYAILIIDVDHFKEFNDKLGHMCGDEVLKYFSSTVRLDLSNDDVVVFRFGGDEFVAVFPGKNSAQATKISRQLRKTIQQRPFLYKGKTIKVTFSGGVASCPMDAKDGMELMEKADEALYASKRRGRARVMSYQQVKIYERVLRGALIFLVLLLFVAFSSLRKPVAEFFQRSSYKTWQVSIAKGLSVEKLVWWLKECAQNNSVDKKPKPISVAKNAESAKGEPISKSSDEKKFVKILLKTGKVVEGQVLEESETDIKLQIAYSTGKGSVRLKRSKIDQIDPI